MKTLSTHAAAAKMMRQELKTAFPTITFRIRSSSFSGGDSVHVEWENGPTDKQIETIVDKYQEGHFNAMQDIYEMTNRRKDIPQVKYVQTRREISESILQEIFEEMRKTYDGWEMLSSLDESCHKLMQKWRAWTARDYILTRVTSKMDLTQAN